MFVLQNLLYVNFFLLPVRSIPMGRPLLQHILLKVSVQKTILTKFESVSSFETVGMLDRTL